MGCVLLASQELEWSHRFVGNGIWAHKLNPAATFYWSVWTKLRGVFYEGYRSCLCIYKFWTCSHGLFSLYFHCMCFFLYLSSFISLKYHDLIFSAIVLYQLQLYVLPNHWFFLCWMYLYLNTENSLLSLFFISCLWFHQELHSCRTLHFTKSYTRVEHYIQ